MLKRNHSWKKDWCGKLHCLILRNCLSYPNLQQPPPWSVNRHQHWGKTFYQQKDYDLLMIEFFSNKVFFNQGMYIFLKIQCYCILNRLKNKVNISFICPGKPKTSCDLLYCGHLELNLWHFQGILVQKNQQKESQPISYQKLCKPEDNVVTSLTHLKKERKKEKTTNPVFYSILYPANISLKK